MESSLKCWNLGKKIIQGYSRKEYIIYQNIPTTFNQFAFKVTIVTTWILKVFEFIITHSTTKHYRKTRRFYCIFTTTLQQHISHLFWIGTCVCVCVCLGRTWFHLQLELMRMTVQCNLACAVDACLRKVNNKDKWKK